MIFERQLSFLHSRNIPDGKKKRTLIQNQIMNLYENGLIKNDKKGLTK